MTAQELTNDLLDLIRRKFYAGEAVEFNKDKRLLLKLVVLWPARWLDDRGVSLHGERYRQVFIRVFIQAASHVTSKINYRPAYLAHVIQEHFKHHGEEY